MARPTVSTPVRRVGGSEARLKAAVAVAAIAVTLAILKPWAAGMSGRGLQLDSRGPAGSTSSESAALPTTDTAGGPPRLLLVADGSGVVRLSGGRTLLCYEPPAWRLVLDETGAGYRTRTWLAVQPGRAAGPLDSSVPVVHVLGDQLVGLGFCAPETSPDQRSIAWTAIVWRLGAEPGGTSRTSLVATTQPPQGGIGGLALAPGSAGTASTWPPGRYVVQLHALGAALPDGWLRVDLEPANSAFGTSSSGG